MPSPLQIFLLSEPGPQSLNLLCDLGQATCPLGASILQPVQRKLCSQGPESRLQRLYHPEPQFPQLPNDQWHSKIPLLFLGTSCSYTPNSSDTPQPRLSEPEPSKIQEPPPILPYTTPPPLLNSLPPTHTLTLLPLAVEYLVPGRGSCEGPGSWTTFQDLCQRLNLPALVPASCQATCGLGRVSAWEAPGSPSPAAEQGGSQ